MPTTTIVHRLALAWLAIVAIQSLAGVVRISGLVSLWPPLFFQFAFGLAFWAFLLHRLWRWPRRWSWRIGLLFVLMLAFQIYLWRRALAGPSPEQLGASRSPWRFALDELPLVAGAIACLWLRWVWSPAQPPPLTAPPA